MPPEFTSGPDGSFRSAEPAAQVIAPVRPWIAATNFKAIARRTAAAERLATRRLSDLMARAVWRIVGDQDALKALLDEDLSDVGRLKLEARDVAKLRAVCVELLRSGWRLGKRQARAETKVQRAKFAFDPSQPRDEDGKWTDGGGDSTGVSENDWQDWAYDSALFNDALRGDLTPGAMSSSGQRVKESDVAEIKAAAERIQAAAESHAVYGVPMLWRGTSFDTEAEARAYYKYGKQIVAEGLVSTATERDVALDYAHSNLQPGQSGAFPVMIRYGSSDGKFVGVQTSPLGVRSNEVVLPKGATYRVARVSEVDGVMTVDLYRSGKIPRGLKEMDARPPKFARMAFEWREEDHPRAPDGKFGEGDGQQSASLIAADKWPDGRTVLIRPKPFGVDGEPLPSRLTSVIKNPSERELRRWASDEVRSVRWFVDYKTGNIAMWDASAALHVQMAGPLGVSLSGDKFDSNDDEGTPIRGVLNAIMERVDDALSDGRIDADMYEKLNDKLSRTSMSRLSFADLRDNAADYLEANGFRMAQNLSDGARAIVQQELTRAVRVGERPESVATAIYTRLLERGFTDYEGVDNEVDNESILADLLDFDDPDAVPQYLNTLVRTNTFEAMNEARFAEFTDPALEGYVVAFEYSAILDENTTDFCRYMDGRIYSAGSEVWDTHRPPNHYNCRSVLIPITKLSNWDGVESEPPEVDPATGFTRCGCKVHKFEWVEELHPRDDDGKFAPGSGGGGSSGRDTGGSGRIKAPSKEITVEVESLNAFGDPIKIPVLRNPKDEDLKRWRGRDIAYLIDERTGDHFLWPSRDSDPWRMADALSKLGHGNLTGGTGRLELGLLDDLREMRATGKRPFFTRASFAEWDESKHPRGPDGKFGEGGGSSDSGEREYHGTSESRAQSILVDGLKAPHGELYSSTSKGVALMYAHSRTALEFKGSREELDDQLVALVALKPDAPEAEQKFDTYRFRTKGLPASSIERVELYRFGDLKNPDQYDLVKPVKVIGGDKFTKVRYVVVPASLILGKKGKTSFAEWREEDHPRGKDGKFGEGGDSRADWQQQGSKYGLYGENTDTYMQHYGQHVLPEDVAARTERYAEEWRDDDLNSQLEADIQNHGVDLPNGAMVFRGMELQSDKQVRQMFGDAGAVITPKNVQSVSTDLDMAAAFAQLGANGPVGLIMEINPRYNVKALPVRVSGQSELLLQRSLRMVSAGAPRKGADGLWRVRVYAYARG